MPTVSQLAYILAVHKHGHFGRAAAEIGVSQPTLSSQIQKAEAELGITIFDRHTKPIALTSHGRQIIELARGVVAAHEKLVAVAAGRFAEPAGPFTLGVIPTLAPFVLPWFVSEFSATYPAVELSIYEKPTDDILLEIGANRLDAAILATPLGESSVVENVLFYDPFYLYGHADEPLLKDDSVDVDDIESDRLWLLADGHCFRAQVINLCGIEERAILGTIKFSGGSFETLRHLIQSAGGYTLVPETYAQTLPRAERQNLIRPFRERIPTREVSVVYHYQSWKQEIISALSDIVRDNMPPCFQDEIAPEEVLPIRIKGQ